MALQDAGFNYRLDHSAAGTSYSMASATRKKGGLMDNTFQLLHLCFDRAVDSGARWLSVGLRAGRVAWLGVNRWAGG